MWVAGAVMATAAVVRALALGRRLGSGLGGRRRRSRFGGRAGGVDAHAGDVGLEGLAVAVVVAGPVGAGGAEARDGAEAEEDDEESAFHGSCHR